MFSFVSSASFLMSIGVGEGAGEPAGDAPGDASGVAARAAAAVVESAPAFVELVVVSNVAGVGVGVGVGVAVAFFASSNTFGPFCTIRLV